MKSFSHKPWTGKKKWRQFSKNDELASSTTMSIIKLFTITSFQKKRANQRLFVSLGSLKYQHVEAGNYVLKNCIQMQFGTIVILQWISVLSISASNKAT